MNSNFENFKSAIARIYHSNGSVVGTGFLVGDGYVVTCAHVVALALGISNTVPETPTGFVYLDFPLAESQKLKAEVVFWLPVNLSQKEEDIAGLKIQGQLPEKIKPLSVKTTNDYWEHKVRIFGFPQGHTQDGIWANGTLRDRGANSWIQIDAVVGENRVIEPGFSGAPVWDDSLDSVVGMVIARVKSKENDPNVKTAFMVPINIVINIIKAYESEVNQKKQEIENFCVVM